MGFFLLKRRQFCSLIELYITLFIIVLFKEGSEKRPRMWLESGLACFFPPTSPWKEVFLGGGMEAAVTLPSFGGWMTYFLHQLPIKGRHWSYKPHKCHLAQETVGPRPESSREWPTAVSWIQLASCPGPAWSGLNWLLPRRNLSLCYEIILLLQ